jgi:hypothetical protein
MSEQPSRLTGAAAVRSQFTWPLPASERSQILEAEIEAYAQRGYRIVTRRTTSAQLLKPKVFSFFWAFAWFLVFGVGLLVYLIYFAAKQDSVIHLSVSEDGEFQVNGGLPGAQSSRGRGQPVVVGIVVGLVGGLLWLAGNSQQPPSSTAPASASGSQSSSDTQARTHLIDARDYRSQGQLGLALVELDRALALAPRLSEASQLQTELRTSATAQIVAAATSAAARNLRILSTSASVDRLGYHHIVGEVRNEGTLQVRFVKIVATYYDEAGTVVGTDSSYVRTSENTLQAGATGPFEITSREVPTMKTYSLQVQT